MKETAVEWLESEMLKPNLGMKEILEQAKEIEKQQIIEFAEYCVELQYESFKTGEDIDADSMEELLETFKTK